MITLTLSLLFLDAGFSSSSPAQKEYKKIKEEIVDSLYLPDFFEAQGVFCYECILQNYAVGAKYPFPYKITYKSKNRLGMDLYSIKYFEYNDEIGSIKKIGNALNQYQINFQKIIKNFNIKLLDKVELLGTMETRFLGYLIQNLELK